MHRMAFCVIVCLFLLTSMVLGQDLIEAVPFDSVPDGATIEGGGQPISLEGDTEVTGDVSATGEVATDTGVRFPDGSLQVSAGATGSGVTANSGLYSNTIPDFTPPQAYTEVCFKGGTFEYDIHSASEPTTGGDCEPGDVGWVIERFERDAGTAVSWTRARAACLMDGMRLPEVFEFQFSCFEADPLAVSDTTDDNEWISNQALPLNGGSFNGVHATVSVPNDCRRLSWAWVGIASQAGSERSFRCVR